MNISLIGMMGCGKSTIGKLLANSLSNYTFTDTDELIIKNEKIDINTIFQTKGEDYFRKIESKVLKDTLKNSNQIISTGGGIIKSEENKTILKDKSIVIYLKAEPKTLYERVKNNQERPLLNCDSMEEKIIKLLDERKTAYEKTAHIIIITDNKSPDDIVSEIEKTLKGQI